MGALIHASKIENKELAAKKSIDKIAAGKKVKENERVSFFRAMNEANKIKEM